MKAFDFIGDDEAYKIVISDINQIANDCNSVKSTSGKKEYPVLDSMDERLNNICYSRAHEIYGGNLPQEINERIQWELEAIRNAESTFAVLLLIEIMAKNGISGDEVSIP